MGIDKLKSGAYRIRKMYKGKMYSMTVNHKPSKSEADRLIWSIIDTEPDPIHGTFGEFAGQYIRNRADVLSPSTVREYKRVLKQLPAALSNRQIKAISREDIQSYINELAKTLSPKTVRNTHGFIAAVMKQYRPGFVLNTALPQKIKKDIYVPTEHDIQRLLREIDARSPQMSIAVRLACLGLRRSEICALELSDLDANNVLTINKALVYGPDHVWDVKSTKTTESTRQITLPAYLADMIRKQRRIYSGFPGSITRRLSNLEDELGIEHFSLHKLRHYFASNSHSLGIPDAYIMQMGGWKTDHVMISVYRHAQTERLQKENNKVIDAMGAFKSVTNPVTNF